jgi:hypothetical protein
MSFDNDYPNRKDWRKPYRRSRAFDRQCRHQGSCDYCSSKRQFKNKRREPIQEEIELPFSVRTSAV